MHLIAEMLEKHDRSRFELVGISFGPTSVDRWRRRAENALDRFVDVSQRSDREVVEIARKLKIDIAVDLKGFTKDARPAIFAARCAPVQVSYLGYPGTTGAPFIDYIIADQVLIPPDSRRLFSEKVAYLPHCYQANCRDRDVADEVLSREDLDLPEEGFVFCCFNATNKIIPAAFDRWMRVLDRCGDSVLWLLESNPWAAENLRTEAERRGVKADRLVFAKPLPIERHLGRLRHADLFLDTLPYNAHTTASDALRMGVPLLTQAGSTFAGRVAASLLTTLGLGELVTVSAQEFEEQAVALAMAPARLSSIRQRLLQAVERSPLYDSTRFTLDLERLYETMYDRSQRGLSPQTILL
jgi:predicted O-linked N-acetylglucosamine transferase (SPINDLY family)